MRITGLSFRRGTSTVMGTLIFVGILFTAVIPMFLVMRQADTLYEMRKYELARYDEERDAERLYVYAHETLGDTDKLTVEVENRGDLSAKVMSLWVNDEFFPLNKMISPMSGVNDLGSFAVTRDEGLEYLVMVTTDRGNIFVLDIPLICVIGGWDSPIISIEVLIEHLPREGEFKIIVTEPDLEVRTATAKKNEITYFTFTSEGKYTVETLRGTKRGHFEEADLDFKNKPLWRVFA